MQIGPILTSCNKVNLVFESTILFKGKHIDYVEKMLLHCALERFYVYG